MNAHLEAQLQCTLADNGFGPTQFQWLRTFHTLLAAQSAPLNTFDLLDAACKQPQLFYQRPETLAEKLPYLTAIAEAQGRSLTAEHIITRQPARLCCSKNYLHLRYILSKTGHLTALSSALVMPTRKAEALAISHFAGKTRTLQVMHAKGLISTLPEGIQPIDPSR